MMLAMASFVALGSAVFIYDAITVISKKRKESTGKTIKFCITGGPCGGKSEGIECLYYNFKEIAAPFFIVPEAATIIGSAGLTLDLSKFEPRQIELFQIYLMRLQYNLQNIIEELSETMQKLLKSPIILCDRGLMDGKAYAGDQNWKRMLDNIKITQTQILNRYKAVIHLQTAARGAEASYFYMRDESQEEKKLEEEKGNKVRKQPPEFAIQLDRKIQNCYREHKMRFVIRNEFFIKDFHTKKMVLLAQMNQILEYCLQFHVEEYYQDYEKKREEGNRKLSEEDIDIDQKSVSPYLVRKRKYQKFLNRNREVSPSKQSMAE